MTLDVTTRTSPWAEAVSILADAWRFFTRHYPVVFAFGAVASVQRFLSVGGTADWAGGPVGETFTALARITFVAWLVHRLLRDEAAPWSGAGARWSAWFRQSWPAVLISMGFLLVFLIVFKAIPDALAGRVGDIDKPTWMSWELAIKNVTVIPFTMLWMTILFATRPMSRDVARAPQPATTSTS